MTFNKLASLIAKREGKKHQASVGDIREILKVFLDIVVEYHFEAEENKKEDPLNKFLSDHCEKKLEKMKKKKDQH